MELCQPISVLMLPWLAHGHISPFLELAKKLTKKNFHIFFCSTPVNLKSIKPKVSEKYYNSIELVELQLPHDELPELPPHYHTTNGLPPHLMPTLKTAFDMASPNFSIILNTLNPDLLIYDFLQPWAPSLALLQNIPAVEFTTTSAATFAFTLHLKNPSGKFPGTAIYLRDYEIRKFKNGLESSSNGIQDGDRIVKCSDLSCKIILVKTSKEIEAQYVDYVSHLMKKKIMAVGPLVQEPPAQDQENGESDIIRWLSRKETSSVVYVSFGSEYFLTKEEIEEIAYGLELSKVSFIWVIRFPVGETIRVEEVFPEGFLGRVGERGKILEGWAPQAKILQHSSIGGFVSHCGWSSVLESIYFGVPIIAIPMHLDQPINARLVEELGVGVEVLKRTGGGCDENGKLQREEVAKVIRDVVVEQIGKGLEIKAVELKDSMRKKESEEIDGVVEELIQLLTGRESST